MIDKKKRRKTKGTISEDDTIPLLQRYHATTILTLLQEVAQSADVQIDWKTIVKSSSTGISNPREYQLLWRHLAYREPLLEKIDEAEPMDDDSDLEFELETIPAVSAEVTSQAATCVKVLMPASFSRESGPQNDSAVEVRSAMDTSNGPTSKTKPSDKEHAAPVSGKNTTPVSLHKQTISTRPLAEGFEGNKTGARGSANKNIRAEESEGNEATVGGSAAKKKRKLWTEEEDTELIAAVQKFGEGNWMNILKGDFKHDRTASQLSQRWSTLKKRLANSNARSSNSISLAQSEVLDAARLALNSALKMPVARSFSVIDAGATGRSSTPSDISTSSPTVSEALRRPLPTQNPNLLQEKGAPEKGNVTPSNKPQSAPRSTPASVKSPITPCSLIKAAAVAAGGKIVASSAAASLIKAAQSKNAIHIRAGGSQLTPTANKGRQQSGSRHYRPFMMPPPANSPMVSNGMMIRRHQEQGSPNFTGKSSVAGAQQNASSPGNAEKVSGNEKCVNDGNRGSSIGVAEGGDEMKLDSALNQDRKGSLGEKDNRMGKNVDITIDNSNV